MQRSKWNAKIKSKYIRWGLYRCTRDRWAFGMLSECSILRTEFDIWSWLGDGEWLPTFLIWNCNSIQESPKFICNNNNCNESSNLILTQQRMLWKSFCCSFQSSIVSGRVKLSSWLQTFLQIVNKKWENSNRVLWNFLRDVMSSLQVVQVNANDANSWN